MDGSHELPAGLVARIERTVGDRLVSAEPVSGGYSPARRLRVRLASGATVFVKAATTPDNAAYLRQEHFVYTHLAAPCLAHRLGWDDDGVCPLLALEDLSAAFWPPPWSPARIDAVLATLAGLAGHRLSGAPWLASLPRLADDESLTCGWARLAADPAPFLSLGLASERWLVAALPTLLAIDYSAALEGDALLHLDVRSDNLCFTGERAILIDWNWACVGNPAFDVAAWLPSLETEGGPPPDALLPGRGDLAAIIAGYFAASAGLPPIPAAPRVRALQLRQLRAALPWAIRALDLPPLDGPTA